MIIRMSESNRELYLRDLPFAGVLAHAARHTHA